MEIFVAAVIVNNIVNKKLITCIGNAFLVF